MQLKIAVLLATYNGARYLEEQIQSLIRQTIKDICIYIHDDGSTDNTRNIIEAYVKKYPNKIFVLNGNPTGGAKYNFFYLMKHVDADYLCFCDQDDVWKPHKIEVQLKNLLEIEGENRKKPCLVWTDMQVVDKDLNLISPSFSEYANLRPQEKGIDRFIVSGKAAGCSMMINKSLQKLCLSIPEDAQGRIIMHDWFLMIVAQMFGSAKYIEETTVLYRQHSTNVVGASPYERKKYIKRAFFRLCSGEQLKITKISLGNNIKQCSCLKYVDNYQDKYTDFVDGICHFDEMHRIQKAWFVIKYKLYQHRATGLWTAVAAFFL